VYPNPQIIPNQSPPNFNPGGNYLAPYPTNPGQIYPPNPYQNPIQNPQGPQPNFSEQKPKKTGNTNYLYIFIVLALVFFSSGVGYFVYENRGGFSDQLLKINTEGLDSSRKLVTIETNSKTLDTKNLSFGLETQVGKFDNDPNKPAINPALYRTFTGQEFTNFYNNFEYLEVKPITVKPAIRSLPEADTVIQTLAETRGYKLRSEATESRLIFVDGKRLQPEAQQSWLQLKTAAAKDKIELTLTSGYRSLIDQKNLFNTDFNLDPSKDPEIVARSQDAKINDTLKNTAIPGYSRHHSGYTIDLGCGNKNQKIFSQSECYEWLSKFNYLNAKRFGFIPSYPSGSSNQGPDPEAWEYVWVGEKNLRS